MNQERLVEDLKQQIQKKQVLIIIGTGVSIEATANSECASWIGLLKHSINRCEDVVHNLPKDWASDRYKELASGDMDDLLAVAQKVSNKLGYPSGGEFRRWLRETIGKLQVKSEKKALLEAIRDLGSVIATCNYDNLIEDVAELQSKTWRQWSEVVRILRGDDKGVVHLHGHWSDPESVILGISSYEKVLGDQRAQEILRAINTFKSLLFIGFGKGLEDPNFGKFIKWIGQTNSENEYRHFRLALESEREEVQKEHPSDQRIFVLSYGKKYEDLTPFLQSISTNTPVDFTTRSTSSVSTIDSLKSISKLHKDIEAITSTKTIKDSDMLSDLKEDKSFIPCNQEGIIRSKKSEIKTHFTLTNKTTGVLSIFWINYYGKREKYFDLLPNETKRQSTFHSQVWLVTDSMNKCLRMFVAPLKNITIE